MDDTLRMMLISNVVNVKFTKVDGEVREMRCTLMESAIPPAEPTETKRKVNPNVTCVYDVDKNAWRSFRNDSVISYSL